MGAEVVATTPELWETFVDICMSLGVDMTQLPALTTPQEIIEFCHTLNIQLQPLYKEVTTLEQSGWTWVVNTPANPAETTDMVVRGVTDLVVTGGGATSIGRGKNLFGTVSRRIAAGAMIAALGVSTFAAQIREHISKLVEGLTPWTTDGVDAVPVMIDEHGNTYLDERAIQQFRQDLIDMGIFNGGYTPDYQEYPINTNIQLQALSFDDAVGQLIEHIQQLYIRNPSDSLFTGYYTYSDLIAIYEKWIELNNTLPGTQIEFTYGQLGSMVVEILPLPDIYGFSLSDTTVGNKTAYIYSAISADNFDVSTLLTNNAGSNGLIDYFVYGSQNIGYKLLPGALSMSSSSESYISQSYNTTYKIASVSYQFRISNEHTRGASFYFPIRVISTTGTYYDGAISPVTYIPSHDSSFNNSQQYMTMRGKGYNKIGIVFNGTIEPSVPGFTPTNPTVGDLTKSLTDIFPDWTDNAVTIPSPKDDDLENTADWLPVSITSTEPFEQDHTATSDDQDGDTTEDVQEGILQRMMELIQSLTQTDTGNPDEVITPTIPVGDSGDTPPATPTVISGASNGLWTIYNPTLSEVQQFGGWLWSSSLIDQIMRQFNSPIDAVIGFMSIYCTPITGDRKVIKAGYLDSPVSAKEVTNQYVTIECGQVEVPEYYHTAVDYTRSKVEIFLPFIGIVPLDCSVVTGSTLEVIYRIDVLTGTCLAQIKVIKQNSDAVMYTYPGNCAVQLPMTASTYTGAIGAIMGAISGGFALGMGDVAGGIKNLGQGLVSGISNLSGTAKSGNLSSNAGALGIRIPYLIITHPTVYDAMIYNQFYGYPSNVYQRLSAMSGFVRVKNIHLDSVSCTEQEREMIYNQLKEGVIIS